MYLSKSPVIGLLCKQPEPKIDRLVSILAKVIGFSWQFAVDANIDSVDALIVVDPSDDRTWLPHIPTIRVYRLGVPSASESLVFQDSDDLPKIFRDLSLPGCGIDLNGAEQALAGKAIAKSGGRTVWTTRTRDGVRTDSYITPSEWIFQDESLFEQFTARKFFGLLPLLEWLRAVCGYYEWSHPPLRANLMFDDPNLHAPSYGYVRFSDLATAASRNNYHVSFATVPLDVDYVNHEAARLFREKTRELSLLIHGNNHTWRELGAALSRGQRCALVSQALRRITVLERKAGLRVDRVMAPPHGACSEDICGELAEAGFDALTVSYGALRTSNRLRDWPHSMGIRMTETVNSLPVMPRFGFADNIFIKSLTTAYLGQPIIIAGHHGDLRDGPELLDEIAAKVNRLGVVQWKRCSELIRSSFRFKVVGSSMWIDCAAHVANFVVPPFVTRVHLFGETLNSDWRQTRLFCAGKQVPVDRTKDCLFATVESGCAVKLDSTFATREAPEPWPKTGSPLPKMRRIGVELRDRAMPFADRFLSRFGWHCA